jgi:multidrug efflux pump subunit AcrA (membrane-fusion protein)
MEDKEFKNSMQPHQYEDIYKSDDVPFQDLSKSVVKKLIWFGVGLFILLIVLSLLIKIPREVNLPFELKGGLEEQIIQYPEQVYIKTAFAQAGDTIKISDSLIEITSPKIVSYLEEVEIWQRELSLYLTSKQQSNIKDIELLQTQIYGLKNEIIKAEKEHKIAQQASIEESGNLKKQLENAEKQHARNKSLHDKEIISDAEFETSLRKVQEAESSLLSVNQTYKLTIAELSTKLQQLTNSKEQYKKEIETIESQHVYELAAIQNKLQLAEKKLELNYGQFRISKNAIVLISPINGVITLQTDNEYEIPAGEIILRIKTDSLSYYVSAEAGATDIGHIKTNTPAILKYNSFPHYYYGTMRARVSAISPSPAENGNFPVKLIITDTGKLASKVTKGMTGTASFIIEEKSVFDFILRSFLKVTTID